MRGYTAKTINVIMAVHGTKGNKIMAVYEMKMTKTMNTIMVVHKTINHNHKGDYGRPWEEDLRP
jgi:hypothetical protein